MYKSLRLFVCLVVAAIVTPNLVKAQTTVGEAVKEAAAKESLAKEDGWVKGANIGLNFTQVYLKNWVGGGQNSIALTGLGNMFADYKKGVHSWDNSLDLAYGAAKLDKGELRKTDDQFLFKSFYSREIAPKWALSAWLDFRTQFTDGYKYDVETKDVNGVVTSTSDVYSSNFLAPGFLSSGIGFTYKVPHFRATISPIATKMTFVLDPYLSSLGAYGVEKDKKMRSQFGAALILHYDRQLMENVKFKTDLLAFSDYKTFIQQIDVNWETQFLFKINKFINASFTTQLIYDEDIPVIRENGTTGPDAQFKSVLNVGFLYAIGAKRNDGKK